MFPNMLKMVWVKPASKHWWRILHVHVAAQCHTWHWKRSARHSGHWKRNVRTQYFGRCRVEQGRGAHGTLKDWGSQKNTFYSKLIGSLLHYIISSTQTCMLSGHRVCREAFLKFIGIGKQRLTRTKKRFRGLDERRLNQGFTAAIIPKKRAKYFTLWVKG